jgi:NAD(P)-dependent dehydrogenase (short-subunit alcohol dehydrogenase family)
MRKNNFLEGQVAIVTGGGRGIGAATAMTLAQAGAAVTVAARTTSTIDAVANRIRRVGGEALAVSMDITDAEQVQAMVQQTIEAFGRIDFLINCAAVVEPVGQSVWEAEPSAWRHAIDIDLTGVFLVSRTVVPHMLRQGSGRLLIVSSPLGEILWPRSSAYSTAKAGVNHFTQLLATELHGTGVTANVVYPGLVETEGLHKFRSGMFREHRLSLGRQMRDLQPSEPARLLLWLCSPFTTYMTGQIVAMNDPIVQYRLQRFLLYYAVGEGW